MGLQEVIEMGFSAESVSTRSHKPIFNVHSDFSVQHGPARARQFYLDPNQLDDSFFGRVSILNFWCPLGQITRDPLGLILWDSVQAGDLKEKRYYYEMQYNPKHEWVYFPHMTTDEALLFKTFDSCEGVARFAPHSALHLEEEP